MRRAWIERRDLWGALAPMPRSPSVRRAWIESTPHNPVAAKIASPSVRRAWIERVISGVGYTYTMSPSVRRAWIESTLPPAPACAIPVALREEGVD